MTMNYYNWASEFAPTSFSCCAHIIQGLDESDFNLHLSNSCYAKVNLNDYWYLEGGVFIMHADTRLGPI